MTEMTDTVRILVLEDNVAVADRLCRILQDWGRARIVGNCAFLKDALGQIETTKVDLLVADIHLGDGSGISAIEAMQKHHPNGQSIVISALSERPLVIDALRAGATGYILKDDDSLGIVEAIEAILDGKSPISIGIARHMIEMIQSGRAQPARSHDAPSLTTREIEILNAIAKGFTNREVAEILGISSQTVPVHIRNIYRKLQATNRTEATYEARRLGILGT
ncbi:response regulator transcription factor [Thioclava sp. A2]|uniref:response regulator transcription factor n=1 Tax=Thioclava sp. FCG-A2 TaxID=3080562 RepID=UPI002952F38A|nr:response regulator transcription factor [Thioclava sp. A2]